MAKTIYTFTEEINGVETTLGDAALQNLEQAKGFSESLPRASLFSTISIKDIAGNVIASKVFDWA